MSISASSERLEVGLLRFARGKWSELGVSSAEDRRSPWAQDIEALVVFTLEIARADPRPFDAMLDWLLVNDDYVSVRQLRTPAHGPADRQLVEATIAWLAEHRPRARFSGKHATRSDTAGALTLVHRAEAGLPLTSRDAAFATHGLLRAPYTPSRQSRPPDLRSPMAFALRLRQLLGVSARGSRASLAHVPGPRSTPAVLARSAGYAKRNVQEALGALMAAQVIALVSVGASSGTASRASPSS